MILKSINYQQTINLEDISYISPIAYSECAYYVNILFKTGHELRFYLIKMKTTETASDFYRAALSERSNLISKSLYA